MKNITISFLIFLVLIVTSTCVRVSSTQIYETPTFENRFININRTDTLAQEVEINEIDSSWPNNEVIFNGGGYTVADVYGEGELWYWNILWNRSYELWYSPALAVGDLDPDYPGLEVVDGLDQVFVIHYDNTTQNWIGTMIWDPWQESGGTQSVEDIKIGDFDLRHPGNELLCVTNGWVREFYKDPNGTWMNETIAENLPRIYKCDIGNFDPRFEGNEVVVFTWDNITIFAWNGSGWYSEWVSVAMYEDLTADVEGGRVGEVFEWNNLSEIVCVAWPSPGVVIVWWDNTTYNLTFVNPYITWGAVAVGDCWTGHEGNEILVGKDETCYLLWEENGEWKAQVIFTAPQYQWITDIEVGEFDTLHPGNEIAVACLDLYEVYEAPPVSETSSAFMLFVCPLIAVPAVVIVIRKWRK